MAESDIALMDVEEIREIVRTAIEDEFDISVKRQGKRLIADFADGRVVILVTPARIDEDAERGT